MTAYVHRPLTAWARAGADALAGAVRRGEIEQPACWGPGPAFRVRMRIPAPEAGPVQSAELDRLCLLAQARLAEFAAVAAGTLGVALPPGGTALTWEDRDALTAAARRHGWEVVEEATEVHLRPTRGWDDDLRGRLRQLRNWRWRDGRAPSWRVPWAGSVSLGRRETASPGDVPDWERELDEAIRARKSAS